MVYGKLGLGRAEMRLLQRRWPHFDDLHLT